MVIKLGDKEKQILEILKENGAQAYVVGGFVRDAMLGREKQDVDISTDAAPERVKEFFSGYKTIDTGLKHGTVTLLFEGEGFEITTFRSEEGYSDGRHPDKVRFSDSFKEDVQRRDFTINAMGADADGKIVDYFGGEEDIESKLIRAVGDAEKRFNEDGLRVLRALRFASVLGFRIEKKTEEAVFKCRDNLKKVSVERLREELNKLLCGQDACRIILEYIDILGVFLPELLPMKGFSQNTKYHIYDVLEHTAHVVDGVPRALHLRLAALLHDSGKPECYTEDEDGTGHFYGHPVVSERIAVQVLGRLKYSNEIKNKVIPLVREHDRNIDPAKTAVKRVMRKYGEEFFFDLLLIKRADNRAQSPEFNRKKMNDELEEIAAEIIKEDEAFSLDKMEVDGRDVIACGVSEGKKVGKALNLLLDAVLEGRVENDKEKLVEYMKRNILDDL